MQNGQSNAPLHVSFDVCLAKAQPKPKGNKMQPERSMERSFGSRDCSEVPAAGGLAHAAGPRAARAGQLPAAAAEPGRSSGFQDGDVRVKVCAHQRIIMFEVDSGHLACQFDSFPV